MVMLHCCCSLLTFLEKQEWIENIILDSSQTSNRTGTFLYAKDLQLNIPHISARDLRNDPGKGLYMHIQKRVHTSNFIAENQHTFYLHCGGSKWPLENILSIIFFSKKNLINEKNSLHRSQPFSTTILTSNLTQFTSF